WIDNFKWSVPCESGQVYYEDVDSDGYGDRETPHPYGELCQPLPGWTADSTDCDDGDPASHPGASEFCDGRDNDCDPATVAPGEVDEDGDGRLLCDGDCDDTDPTRYAGATELCDGIDNDCDGVTEDADTDTDGDGVPLCEGDCDDNNKDVWPGAIEACGDNRDADCDGEDPECSNPDTRPERRRVEGD
ncbi:MAG: putative metal-binding motif-containing protein, partial [Myxococcota bacterium]|nr:putative metal-binding motif-containing protein [Myxococcota bacterium]